MTNMQAHKGQLLSKCPLIALIWTTDNLFLRLVLSIRTLDIIERWKICSQKTITEHTYAYTRCVLALMFVHFNLLRPRVLGAHRSCTNYVIFRSKLNQLMTKRNCLLETTGHSSVAYKYKLAFASSVLSIRCEKKTGNIVSVVKVWKKNTGPFHFQKFTSHNSINWANRS